MRLPLIFLMALATLTLRASNLDTIGVTLLRKFDPTLTGNGIPVAQVEAPLNTNSPPPFEVNPATVGQPTNLFTYISDIGTATDFPNAVGVESSHADSVGVNFFSPFGGIAPQVNHVDNYEANYFYNNIINPTLPPSPSINARVVNQSFIFDGLSNSEQLQVEQGYDNYVATYNTIIASGAGNGGAVFPAATAYNVIGVGASDGGSSHGPTADGRSKPDIVAPGGATSFSTPYVSGAAAILLQAASRGDGGTNVSDASDARTVKALLLNGAVKPLNWTNGVSIPLDARYGAGVLNVFNSWQELKGGKHAFIESTTVSSGGTHSPGSNSNNEPSLIGWDFNTLSTFPPTQDTINHYYFTLPGTNAFTLAATLTWDRQANQTGVNDLNLFLFDVTTGNQILSSTSTVDNVEHLFLPRLPPGRYDLQVLKRGSITQVSASETYALAFEFSNVVLAIQLNNNSAVLSWPVSPGGFELQSTPSLNTPIWTTVTTPVVVDTNSAINKVSLPLTNAMQFFRLQRP